MTTALIPPPDTTSAADRPAGLPLTPTARVAFRQPISRTGFLDAAWWPRSRDLAAEVPALVEGLSSAGRDITRITFHLAAWAPAPRRIVVDGRVVRLGGFVTGDPLTAQLSDALGRERIDVLVIPAETDPAVAERALRLASEPGNPYSAQEILTRAAGQS